MNNMLRIIGSVVCCCLVSPVSAHYIFDDIRTGYLSASNDGENFRKNQIQHKKFYIGNNNQNFKLLNERTLDSHFKMQKPTPGSYAGVSMNTLIPMILSDVSANNHRQLKGADNSDLSNTRKMEFRTDHGDNNFKTTTHRDEMLRNNDIYYVTSKNLDTNKGTYQENQQNLKLNHYRLQIDTDSNKQGSLNNPKSNKMTQISENEERIPHRSNINNDRNAIGMARLSETQQHSNLKSLKQDENRKRDIAKIDSNYSDNSITKDEKFVTNNGGVKQVQQGSHAVKHMEGKRHGNYSPARIGRYNIKTKTKNKPYALFYVMNHENFDQPDTILSENRNYDQEPINNFYNTVTNYKTIHRKNQGVQNYAVFRDR